MHACKFAELGVSWRAYSTDTAEQNENINAIVQNACHAYLEISALESFADTAVLDLCIRTSVQNAHDAYVWIFWRLTLLTTLCRICVSMQAIRMLMMRTFEYSWWLPLLTTLRRICVSVQVRTRLPCSCSMDCRGRLWSFPGSDCRSVGSTFPHSSRGKDMILYEVCPLGWCLGFQTLVHLRHYHQRVSVYGEFSSPGMCLLLCESDSSVRCEPDQNFHSGCIWWMNYLQVLPSKSFKWASCEGRPVGQRTYRRAWSLGVHSSK